MKKIGLYFVLIFLLSVYSFVLVDPNFTPFSSVVWSVFRNFMVQIGYYQRIWSFVLYSILIIALFVFQYFLMKQKVSPVRVALGVGILTLCAYPFLSHDFFNYLFDAKIVSYYHQNPYIRAAWDFPADPDLRFMHWVQRTYPYGPVFLVLTVIPSFVSFGKFIISFVLFKALWSFMYVAATAALTRVNKKVALFFATSPLIIVEGLINGHNDLIAVTFGLMALYGAVQKKNVLLSYGLFAASVGIKFTAAPFVFLLTKWRYAVPVVMVGFVATLAYSYTKVGIQPWYFLNLLILLPFALAYMFEFSVLSLFLLFSYYPYIVLGGWDTQDKVLLKERIIFAGVLIFTILLARKMIPKIQSKQPTINTRSS